MKKLIAVAVATAFIAPISTMAAPTLYGKIHMDTSYADGGTAAGGNLSVNSNNTSIGIKGSEDLGNGLKAIYAIEWKIDMRGSTAISNRHRFVGIGGGFGTVLAGRLNTPGKMLGRKVDLFGDRMGTTRSVNGASGALLDIYAPNAIAYASPKLGGFKATLAYVTDASGATDDDNDGDGSSASVVYNNGPIFAGLGYTQLSGQTFSQTEDQFYWRAVGGYKFAGARVVASYTDISDARGIKDKDSTIWHLGGSYKFGSNTAKIQYTQLSSDANDSDANNITIGVDHNLSKRTMAYLSYSVNDNDTNVATSPWSHPSVGQSIAAAAGEKADAITLGILHKF